MYSERKQDLIKTSFNVRFVESNRWMEEGFVFKFREIRQLGYNIEAIKISSGLDVLNLWVTDDWREEYFSIELKLKVALK